jgi:hypothetical protein
MGPSLLLRRDFGAAALQIMAFHTKDAARARRLLALAVVHDAAMRTEVARISRVTTKRLPGSGSPNCGTILWLVGSAALANQNGRRDGRLVVAAEER